METRDFVENQSLRKKRKQDQVDKYFFTIGLLYPKIYNPSLSYDRSYCLIKGRKGEFPLIILKLLYNYDYRMGIPDTQDGFYYFLPLNQDDD